MNWQRSLKFLQISCENSLANIKLFKSWLSKIVNIGGFITLLITSLSSEVTKLEKKNWQKINIILNHSKVF